MAIAKITSSFMVITSDGQKNNLGLSLKFEAKALKVIDYSRKDGRHWEFSEKAVELIREYKEKYPEVFRTLSHSGDGECPSSADVETSLLKPAQSHDTCERRFPRRRGRASQRG